MRINFGKLKVLGRLLKTMNIVPLPEGYTFIYRVYDVHVIYGYKGSIYYGRTKEQGPITDPETMITEIYQLPDVNYSGRYIVDSSYSDDHVWLLFDDGTIAIASVNIIVKDFWSHGRFEFGGIYWESKKMLDFPQKIIGINKTTIVYLNSLGTVKLMKNFGKARIIMQSCKDIDANNNDVYGITKLNKIIKYDTVHNNIKQPKDVYIRSNFHAFVRRIERYKTHGLITTTGMFHKYSWESFENPKMIPFSKELLRGARSINLSVDIFIFDYKREHTIRMFTPEDDLQEFTGYSMMLLYGTKSDFHNDLYLFKIPCQKSMFAKVTHGLYDLSIIIG